MDFREDQSQKKLSTKKDEIGAINRAVDTLRGHLSGVIGRIEVQTMDEVKEVMADQDENVGLTRDRFAEMHSGVEKTIEGIRIIAGKMEQIDDTRTGVVDIVQNLSSLSEENAAGTQEVSASVTEVGEHMSRIAKNSGELRQVADGCRRRWRFLQFNRAKELWAEKSCRETGGTFVMLRNIFAFFGFSA